MGEDAVGSVLNGNEEFTLVMEQEVIEIFIFNAVIDFFVFFRMHKNIIRAFHFNEFICVIIVFK